MITEHAPLAPSSAPQWGYCSGSVAANLQAPDVNAARTREGTASHWVGAEVLDHWRRPYETNVPVMLCTDLIGKTAPNGVVIDEEMAEGAEYWVQEVLDVCGDGHLPRLLVEERVNMPDIHPDNWGTEDSSAWIPDLNTLYLWDYKYGHREVDAVENLQLIDYVKGLLNTHMIPPTARVVMRVVQPFCYHAPSTVREWVQTVEQLTPWFEHLSRQAHEAMTCPTMTAGKHCRDCAAISRCSTAKRAGYSVITYAGEPYDISILEGPDLAAERRILTEGLQIVKARLKAVDDELYQQVSDGDKSSGLTLETKQGRLAWTVSPAEAILFAEQFQIDVTKPAARTPTQAIAAASKETRPMFAKAVKAITERPSTGVKLVQVENSKTARAFNRSKK